MDVNRKINHLHEQSLRIVYKDNYSSYVDRFAEDKSYTIHQRNISNAMLCNILKTRTLTHNLPSQTDFVKDCVNTRRHGLNSLSYFAPKVCDMVPSEIKNAYYLHKFKTEIRKWTPENFSRYLCRLYIQNSDLV